MFEVITKIGEFFAGIADFFGRVWDALKTAFVFIVQVWAQVRDLCNAFPVWLKAILVLCVIMAIVMIVLLSR